jgi:hypothetical protein
LFLFEFLAFSIFFCSVPSSLWFIELFTLDVFVVFLAGIDEPTVSPSLPEILPEMFVLAAIGPDLEPVPACYF